MDGISYGPMDRCLNFLSSALLLLSEWAHLCLFQDSSTVVIFMFASTCWEHGEQCE